MVRTTVLNRLSWMCLATMVLVGAGAVAASPSVVAASEMRLTVSVPHPDADNGVATNQLRLGMEPAASNGFDPSLDLEAFPTPALSAVVRHPEYPAVHQALWWDLRAETLPQSWDVEISSDRPNASITISGAAPSSVPNGCAQGRWTLRDVQTGQTLEFGSSSLTYAFSNAVGVIRRFVVSAADALATPPPAPANLWSPRQGRASVYLVWSSSGDPSIRYQVYRETDQGLIRLTAASIATASFVDTGVDRTKPLIYRVTAVSESGCESAPSTALTLSPHR